VPSPYAWRAAAGGQRPGSGAPTPAAVLLAAVVPAAATLALTARRGTRRTG